MTGRVPAVAVAALLVAAVVATLVGPFPVTSGVVRLAGWVLLVAGASAVVGRTAAVDLSTAAVAAAGTYLGAVAVPLVGGPAVLGLAVGGVSGGVVGGLTGALAGRVGGVLAALPTLSVTVAVVAILRSVPAWGGSAGYHAAPFLTGGEVGDAAAVVALAGAGVAGVATWWGSTSGARAVVGAGAPEALSALGHSPGRATSGAGIVGGVLLGMGGAAQAFASGSAAPSAFGLSLAAALAIAVLVGGAPPLGPLLGALWVWGPAVVFPLAPVVGDAPPLLTTGLAGLGLLAARRGRPLVDRALPAPDLAAVPGPLPAPRADVVDAPIVLEVDSGPGHDGLHARPGEVVAVVGPNGAGKSTLLARISGQLPDHGTVRLHGTPAPRGPVRRARAGMGRTWQRPPEVAARDLLIAAGTATGATTLVRRIAGMLPDPAGSPASAQLLAALSTTPDVVLLDEPGTDLSEEVVADVARSLAAAGLAVVLVDHRPAVLAVADRTCAVHPTAPGEP